MIKAGGIVKKYMVYPEYKDSGVEWWGKTAKCKISLDEDVEILRVLRHSQDWRGVLDKENV